jgi:Flp pilus assembly protein TadD
MRNITLYIRVLALGALVLATPAVAQDDTARVALEQSYQALLQNPGDRQLNLNYAALAMQLKDYESAIPPLERILMNEPANAKIRLQIGILYHLLGSRVIAKDYFMETVATPGAPAEIVKEAQGYLHGA